MQVTGSNRDKNRTARLSIRIPNGQSLHRDTLSIEDEVTAVELTIEGSDVVAFPKELSERIDMRAMFAAAGITIGEGCKVVIANTEGSIGYALSISEECAQWVEELRSKGLEVSLHTPLSKVVVRAIVGSRHPKTAVLLIAEGVTYAAVSHDKRVQFAEALPMDGEEQIVNLLAHLNQDYDLGKARFILLGESSAKYYKTIRKYFRRVSCEK